jgi:hypothetical protein
MDILNAVKGDVAVTWPGPTKDDLALIGAIIVQFSYLDFYLRRAIEVLDHAKMGPEKWRGRTGKMPMGEVEAFMRSMRDMTPQNQLAFDDMKDAAHDIALDEQLLLLLRGCRADTAENRHRQCNSAQRPGIR